VVSRLLGVWQALHYVAELTNDDEVGLAFEAGVGGRAARRIDILRFDDQGLINKITVMVRPFTAPDRAQVMIPDGLMNRVGRLVLASCEVYDHYAPGLPGNVAWLSAKLPGGLSMARRSVKVGALRESPLSLCRMTKRGIPDEVVAEWVEPLKSREIRRDFRKYAGQARRVGRPALIAASKSLASFDRPGLVVWAKEDRVMAPEHGRRLAKDFSKGRLVEIADSYTLIPEYQPQELARAIGEFVAETEALRPRKSPVSQSDVTQ
jgi:pimeloyl-ACP methyl ester carboxylesterase